MRRTPLLIPYLLGLLALTCSLASAQVTSAAHEAALAPPTEAPAGKTNPSFGLHALTAADVEAFLDGVIPLQLERSDIAGASVLVMQGDTVLLQKGYGFADAKKKQPVDPARTIFRLASISKLFTWVSIMQLEEQGRLSLDADISQYLDFQIAPAFNKPVTLRNLMTHTGGFEEVDRDVIVTDPKKSPSLRDFLIHNQPKRLFAPGTVPAYSNYGVGLAGYIVQRVSGEPFEQYVSEHIFQPLEMSGSSFYQPVQPGVAATPSEGYRGDTEKPPVGFEIFNPAPAGGLSSTASDMGHFAEMLLHGGELNGHRILKPETLARMWTPQFRSSDRMPPIDMGFYETWRNDTHWIGHEGDLIAFHSLFFLDPASRTTLFVSYNSAGGGDKPRPELIDLFTDRYFPRKTFSAVSAEQLKPGNLKEIEGTYQTTRRADSNRASLLAVFEQTHATVDKDGLLHLSASKDLRSHPIKWKMIAKDLWQEVDGQHQVFAIRDENGRIVRLAGDFPGVQRQRVAWWQTAGFFAFIASAAFAVLICVLLAPLFRLGKRIFLRHRPRSQPTQGTVRLPWTAWLAAALWVVPTLVFTLLLTSHADTLMPPSSAWDKLFLLMNGVIGLALLLSLLPLISARRIWQVREVRLISRIKFTLVAVSCLAVGWLSLHFHLIGTLRI